VVEDDNASSLNVVFNEIARSTDSEEAEQEHKDGAEVRRSGVLAPRLDRVENGVLEQDPFFLFLGPPCAPAGPAPSRLLAR